MQTQKTFPLLLSSLALMVLVGQGCVVEVYDPSAELNESTPVEDEVQGEEEEEEEVTEEPAAEVVGEEEMGEEEVGEEGGEVEEEATKDESLEVLREEATSETVVEDLGNTGEEQGFFFIDGELLLLGKGTSEGVELHWSQTTSGNFSAYKLVRSEVTDAPSFPESPAIATLPSRSGTAFVDTSAAKGETYYYRACSTETDGAIYCGNVLKVTF